jgi:hypothetical protein
MKKLILFSLFAITTSVASSQLNKGQWLIGGEANFTSSNFESSNKTILTIFQLYKINLHYRKGSINELK